MSIARPNQQQDIASAIWQEKLVVIGSANSVAAYKPQGTLIEALQNKLANSVCIAAAYEFGTIPETEVFHALRADSWLQAYGDLNGKLAYQIKRNMLNAFYCYEDRWQESVFNLALTAQEELLAGLRNCW